MRKLDTNVVAEGEVTNHAHRATGEGVALYDLEDGTGEKFIEAPNGFTLTHEEHHALTIPASETGYITRIVKEFDPIQDAVRNVAD